MFVTPKNFQIPEIDSGGRDQPAEDEKEWSYEVPDSQKTRTGQDRLASDFDTHDWRNTLRTEIASQLRKASETLGYPSFALDSWFKDNYDRLQSWLDPQVVSQQEIDQFKDFNFSSPDFQLQFGEGASNQIQQGKQITSFMEGKINPFSPEGLVEVFNASMSWIDRELGGLLAAINQPTTGPRGGGGSRGPTAAEIRNSMDLNQLTQAVTDLGRAYLADEVKDARTIASAYIEKIVATGAMEEIDFKTFVLTNFKARPRWGTLYQNKPEGVDELQFLQPYAQAALKAGGRNMPELVAQGAALAQTGEEFASRLQRESGVRNSSAFITGIEQSVRGVKDILRG